jgi:hypothetical protein
VTRHVAFALCLSWMGGCGGKGEQGRPDAPADGPGADAPVRDGAVDTPVSAPDIRDDVATAAEPSTDGPPDGAVPDAGGIADGPVGDGPLPDRVPDMAIPPTDGPADTVPPPDLTIPDADASPV